MSNSRSAIAPRRRSLSSSSRNGNDPAGERHSMSCRPDNSRSSMLTRTVRGLARGALVVVLALSASQAGAREKPKEEKALIGTPQVVKDLHWGDVLFYFYQDDYIQALTRLGASQDFNRIHNHMVEAELLKGGLYLSLGQHEEAGRIFKSLL